jgi:hypothetical protein
MPLNEITALMSGSQIQNPQFGAYQGSTVAPPPIFQATQQKGMFDANAYNQQVAQANAQTAGMYSLGGAALGGPKSLTQIEIKIVRLGLTQLDWIMNTIFLAVAIGVMAKS